MNWSTIITVLCTHLICLLLSSVWKDINWITEWMRKGLRLHGPRMKRSRAFFHLIEWNGIEWKIYAQQVFFGDLSLLHFISVHSVKISSFFIHFSWTSVAFFSFFRVAAFGNICEIKRNGFKRCVDMHAHSHKNNNSTSCDNSLSMQNDRTRISFSIIFIFVCCVCGCVAANA